MCTQTFSRLRPFLLVVTILSNILMANGQELVTPLCESNFPEPSDNCFTACASCSINNYYGSTDGFGADGFPPAFCSNVQNDQWIAFVAGAVSMEITITPSNCVMGSGIQAAVYDQCDGNIIACNAGCNNCGTTPATLALDNLVIGKTYFLMIDGYSGDICDFAVVITPPSAATAPFVGQIGQIQGPVEICQGGTYTYTVPAVSGAGYYTWSSSNPNVLFNGWPSPATFSAPAGRLVEVTIPEQAFGNLQILVQPSNACVTGGIRAKTLLVNGELALDLFNDITDWELPFTLPWGAQVNAGGEFMHTTQSGMGCDTSFNYFLTVHPGQARVITYQDDNDNGVFDSNEPLIPHVTVRFGNKERQTDATGQTFLYGLSPGDPIDLALPPMVLSSPILHQFSPSIQEYYFGLRPDVLLDLRVDISSTVFRPGFNSYVYITVTNGGIAAVNNIPLTFIKPSFINFLGANPFPSNLPMSNEFTWQISSLLPGESKSFQVTLNTPTSITAITPVHLSAFVPVLPNEPNTLNNTATITPIVVNAYDPNDKLADPAWILPSQWAQRPTIAYTVRFQNTGNYHADFVVLIDTLSDLIDPSSFRMVASSHPCTWALKQGGKVLEVRFDSILLQPAILDEPGSHGFFKYSVRPKQALGVGHTISNFCDIYFDFNPPIRTNTTDSKAVFFPPNNFPANTSPAPWFTVRPNPASFQVTCSWETPLTGDGILWIIGADGIDRLQVAVPQGAVEAEANVAFLPAGTYLVRLEAPGMLEQRQIVIARTGPIRRRE